MLVEFEITLLRRTMHRPISWQLLKIWCQNVSIKSLKIDFQKYDSISDLFRWPSVSDGSLFSTIVCVRVPPVVSLYKWQCNVCYKNTSMSVLVPVVMLKRLGNRLPKKIDKVSDVWKKLSEVVNITHIIFRRFLFCSSKEATFSRIWADLFHLYTLKRCSSTSQYSSTTILLQADDTWRRFFQNHGSTRRTWLHFTHMKN